MRDKTMQMLLEFFGFTTVSNTIWNAIAYGAFIVIIIGVLSERYRNVLIALGAATLAFYAGFFLQNQLFTALQTLITVSGILKLTNVSRWPAMVVLIFLTIGAYLILILGGALHDGWTLVGSFGLLGIAFGLAVLPKQYGFLLMAAGGVLLVIYAFVAPAWVFFFLNIFFVIANIRTWMKG